MTGRRLSSLRAATRGSAAIEFGLLAFPFCILLIFLLDVSMMFIADTLLDRALQKVARQIRTGQAQTASMTSTTFKAAVCEAMLELFDCSDNVYLCVSVISDVSSVTFIDPVNSDGTLTTTEYFDIGSAGDYILVQGFLPWTSYTAWMSGYANTLANGATLLSTAALFRNEPFE
jgi:Flp pilus assembly protein TadG